MKENGIFYMDVVGVAMSCDMAPYRMIGRTSELLKLCRGRESNPQGIKPHDFESCVFTSFTTAALFQLIKLDPSGQYG